MKNSILLIGSIIMILILNSCKKDYPNPDSNIECSLNFQSNSKNSQYQNLLDDYAKKGFVGLTLLIDNPADGLWMGSSGFADIEHKIKMTPCHTHHTASIFKSYIAVVIMQMVQEGKIDLDDYVSKYVLASILNKLPNGKKVTIKNLLQHRSGMPDIFEIDFLMDFFNNPTRSYSIEELLTYLYDMKAKSEPGTTFYYSDANFALLSLVINSIDGDYGQSINARIIQRLNLDETFFIENKYQSPYGLADSYWDRYGDGKIENISDIQMALTAGLRGTDGIITSANDMKIFIQALFNSSIVSTSSLVQMTSSIDVPKSEQDKHGITGYGLGLMRVNVGKNSWYGHLGSHIGSGAIALHNPAKNITIVVFQNTGTFFSDKIKPLFFNQLVKDIEEIAYK
ncbi:MAG: class A beta-lactamase-related serine hydrolase [Bacteroidales bacterium]|nr:MAG: class A beta-lactamase-related serine hydrolase [Bacteroidales bacterium]